MTGNGQFIAEPAGDETRLRREIGVLGATMMGLGSIIGTGVFVSIGVAAGIAGPSVILAIALAAVVAACNALNSAQLAASHPVSGGTYEYGYQYLNGWLGFAAGWLFVCAKSASAATAALGLAGYALTFVRFDGRDARIALGEAVILLLTLLVATGIRWSSRLNIAIVSATILSLICFCVAGIPEAARAGSRNLVPFFPSATGEEQSSIAAVLHAAALMFVAFTGYGRIATLGEEVRDPERTIPRAVLLAMIVSAVLYIAVGVVGIAAAGAPALSEATASDAAPLEIVAQRFGFAGVPQLVAVGAITAMLGVLLNLILGNSRVVLAMARRGDMPGVLVRLNHDRTTPPFAVVLAGAVIAGLTLVGNVKTTWSFSAFTVLVYYAITNLAALRLPESKRLFSKLYAYGGLIACLFLAFQVEVRVWLAGLGLLGLGLAWRLAARWLSRRHGEKRRDEN
jgi:APA family basic amino acid/polyamine antiporter